MGRWRKLEGSDPTTYEMIQKIQTLQKRLIAKTEEVVEKDLLIQEKEKLYLELKHIMVSCNCNAVGWQRGRWPAAVFGNYLECQVWQSFFKLIFHRFNTCVVTCAQSECRPLNCAGLSGQSFSS